MTVRRARLLYILIVIIALLASWLLAYFVAWWAGMGLLTIILIDHMRYTVKQIAQRYKPGEKR